MNKIKIKFNKLRKNKFWKNLFKNSFWAFLGESTASFIGLIVTIFLIKIIGSEDYGILVLAQSYMSIMDVLINIQSWKSVIQFGQKSIVSNDYDNLNSYIKLGTILDVSTAILCCIIAFIVSSLIGNIFNWSSELIFCARIFSLTIISHFAGTPTAILRIFNKFHLVALQKFIGAMIKLISLIVLYIFLKNINLYVVTIVYCVTDIINNLLLVLFAFIIYNKKCGIKNVYKAKMPTDSKKFINFTIWGTISEIVDIPVNYFDVFIISLLGNSLVSVFKVFKQCCSILQRVSSPIQQSILPQFSELAAKKDERRGYEVVQKIHKTMMLIILPISILIGLSSIGWLQILYGNLYSDNWYILLIYLVIQTYALSYSTIHPYFLSLNQPKKSAIYVLIANIIYMLLAFIIVRYIGMLGIVLSYMVQCFTVIFLKKKFIIKILKKRCENETI